QGESEDPKAGEPITTHALLHVEQALATRFLVDRDEGVGVLAHAGTSTGKKLRLNLNDERRCYGAQSTICSSFASHLRLLIPSSATTTRSSIRTPSLPGR